MTMDLWYDLAARELPDSDEELIERLHISDGVEPPHEPEHAAPGGVDSEGGVSSPASAPTTRA